ncbi:hypothetical protein [Ekhidna sp.]|uniref:hypothetical protein n=1 Tax=Ekhidna sp. TaxID=2608089 RepID=UPI003CCBC52F
MNKERIIQTMKGKHVVIFLIIVVACYGLINGLQQLLARPELWSESDNEILVNKCIKDAGKTATKDPDLTKEYCICTTKKIQENFSKQEYLRISSESTGKQFQEIMPVIETCLKELEQKIKGNKNNLQIPNSNQS